ncbi:hypothetical protein ACH5RR_007264 [Cinchona calisaya]|uniref:Uncharacterized protein n=1 Tax=Cinchona calisaya TaxID=153742 RepID=A0ABD3ARE3_9GENT
MATMINSKKDRNATGEKKIADEAATMLTMKDATMRISEHGHHENHGHRMDCDWSHDHDPYHSWIGPREPQIHLWNQPKRTEVAEAAAHIAKV